MQAKAAASPALTGGVTCQFTDICHSWRRAVGNSETRAQRGLARFGSRPITSVASRLSSFDWQSRWSRSCLTKARTLTAPGFFQISIRSAASVPTRPAFTSRLFPSRTCVRWSGWRSGFLRLVSPPRSTASETFLAPVPNLARNCWRGRISKARILRAGSMGAWRRLCAGSRPRHQS
jgi:hypothetical protein